MKYLWLILLSLISALFYRLGGIGKPWNGKIRDIGCSLLALAGIWLLKGFNLAFWGVYLAIFLLSWGAISTYWKFGFLEDSDVKWYHWLLHGIGIGLACLPLIWAGIHPVMIIARTILLGLLMMWVSEKNDNVWIEECGRGMFIVLSLPVLFI